MDFFENVDESRVVEPREVDTTLDLDFCKNSDQSRVLDEANANWELDFLHQDPVLRYINHMLLEEATVDEVEPLALRTTEKAFYDALVNNVVQSSESNTAVSLFHRGMEEGQKFLPSLTQLNKVNVNTLSERSAVRSRNRKNPDDDDDEEERRNSKQSATDFSVGEYELSEKFDRVLLNHEPPDDLRFGESYGTRSSGPDIGALLMSCAQSIAANDRTSANETLNQIKNHVSKTGDPVQRVAYIFANALEARLDGTGNEKYTSPILRRMSASEQLKLYQVFHTTPFKVIPVIFGNHMILKKVTKVKALHIIDFGIGFGFQWPSLIQHLSQRPNGPPKLKITGVDVPQPGLKPLERLHDTGTRLARYCARFGVPFEYKVMVTKTWESIDIREMNTCRAEVLVVNCQFCLGDTVPENSPRDSVLKLIRTLKPDILLTTHVNAHHASPVFLTRFRESLFFCSTLFDAFDNLLPRDDEQRMRYEQDMYGGHIMNLVACEGRARADRAESYKEWEMWCSRAGFKLLPLGNDLVKELKDIVKKNYHKDFVVDEVGSWLLQGWKGRNMTAISGWVPT